MRFSELERQFLLLASLQTAIKKSNSFNIVFLLQKSKSWSLILLDDLLYHTLINI